nr:DUF6207 family protein [Streptomyces sp. Ag109_O5-1]
MPSSSCSPTGGRRRAAEHTTRNAGEPGVRLRCYWTCASSSPTTVAGDIPGERREHPFSLRWAAGNPPPARPRPSCSFPRLCGRAIRVQPDVAIDPAETARARRSRQRIR